MPQFKAEDAKIIVDQVAHALSGWREEGLQISKRRKKRVV